MDLPSRSDPVVAGLSEVIGGPVGDHASGRSRWFWTPMRVILALTCLVIAFNWVQKSPCRDGRWVNNVQYTKACYSDVLALYFSEELNKGAVPYIDHPVEYPVLTGFLMGAIGLPVHALGQSTWVNETLLPGLARFGLAEGGPLNEGKLFYDLNALFLGVCAVLTAWAVVRMRRRRPWDAALVALAPATFFTATVNWDLFPVALCTLGLYAWARRSPPWAGVLLGLAAAAKFYPLLILGPLLLLCIRRRRVQDFMATLGMGIAAWGAVNIPVYVANPSAWWRFYQFNKDRGVDWGTFWYIGGHFQLGPYKPDMPFFGKLTLHEHVGLLNGLSMAAFLACCAGIAALIMLAPKTPRLAAVAFLVVAAFLLTNKVWSQQYVLWLVPLAVLARPRWRAFLAWQACEVAYFLAFYQIMLRSSQNGKSLMPESVFTYAAIARWLSVAALCFFVVREVLRPDRDVVRSPAEYDPDGGVLLDLPAELAGQPSRQLAGVGAAGAPGTAGHRDWDAEGAGSGVGRWSEDGERLWVGEGGEPRTAAPLDDDYGPPQEADPLDAERAESEARPGVAAQPGVAAPARGARAADAAEPGDGGAGAGDRPLASDGRRSARVEGEDDGSPDLGPA